MENFKILKDPKLNRSLVSNGFVVLKIFHEQQIEFFKQLYSKWHFEPQNAFYKSYFSQNNVYKNEVEAAIIKHTENTIKNHFVENNLKVFGGMFVVKPPNEKGHIPPHQDWSFVDERNYWSLNMWLPLQDVNERNGTLRFVKGSHLFENTIRGAHTDEWYDHVYDIIENNLTDVNVHAGEAIFFFHNTLHCSHYNTMKTERVCLGLSLIEKNAEVYYHFLDKQSNSLECYKINDLSFYKNYVSNRELKPQNSKIISKTNYIQPKIAREDFIKLIARHSQ